MRRKCLLYMAIVSLLLLCACGGSGESAGTLTLCIDGNGLGEGFLGPILAEFERQNPKVELTVEYLPPVNSADSAMMEEREAALARARTGLMSGEGADIYLFLNNASPKDHETYMLFPNLDLQIQGNTLHDLDFLFEHAEFDESRYVAGIQQAGVYEGKSYVLPLSYSTPLFVGLAEPLRNSGFDEERANANTKAYIEEMLALSEEQRPYFALGCRYSLLKAGTLSPVSAEEAKIQLNAPPWQEMIELNRHVMQTCGYTEEDARKAAEGYGQNIEDGAAVLSFLSSQPGYYMRLLEDGGNTARLLPIPNENGGITMMPFVSAVVSAGCKNTDAAASLLLFLLSETVQGCEVLEQSGSRANLLFRGIDWPVRKGCAKKALEALDLTLVEPGAVSEVLASDLENMENRIDTCRLGTSYDAKLPSLIEPYLDGLQTWEECYANIEQEWSYLDE